MTYESRIDANSRVGEYLVQCAGRPLVRVLMGPGGVARAFPEPWLRPAVHWAGAWINDAQIEIGDRWSMTVEVRSGTTIVDQGIVQSIDAVAQSVPVLLPGSPAGVYRAFSRKDHLVVWLSGEGARVAHGPVLETESYEYRGDGRAHEVSSYIFIVGERATVTWAGMDPEKGMPGFTTNAPIYRIDWLAPSEIRKQPLDR